MATTPENIRLLCDEMLKGLARWLRAAGYDTQVCESGLPDRIVLQRAREENRLLITRDHKLKEFRDATTTVIWLHCNDTESCVQALSKVLSVNWLRNPFSRCLDCNTLLIKADAEKLSRVPAESRKLARPLWYCPACDKVYWEGSHVDRMRSQLNAWAGH